MITIFNQKMIEIGRYFSRSIIPTNFEHHMIFSCLNKDYNVLISCQWLWKWIFYSITMKDQLTKRKSSIQAIEYGSACLFVSKYTWSERTTEMLIFINNLFVIQSTDLQHDNRHHSYPYEIRLSHLWTCNVSVSMLKLKYVWLLVYLNCYCYLYYCFVHEDALLNLD